MATTAQSDLKTLDLTRHRLLQLTNALNSFRRDLELSDPLPSWSTLSTTFTLLTHHLTTLSTTLSNPGSGPLLRIAHAYPLPSFPYGAVNEAILTQLLRKKLDPGVEDWVGDAAAAAAAQFGQGMRDKVEVGGVGGRSSAEGMGAMWEWAKPRAGELAAGMPWGIDYSVAEREGGVEELVTGIERKLDVGAESGEEDEDHDDDDDHDDDNDDDEEEDRDGGCEKKSGGDKSSEQEPVKRGTMRAVETPMMSLEEVLRFASTGTLPPRSFGGRGPGPGLVGLGSGTPR